MKTQTKQLLTDQLKYVLLGIIFYYIGVQLIQVFLQIDLFPINKFTLGIDFRDYYNALINFSNGISIYSDDLIVTPPTFLLFLQPFHLLPFESAVKGYFYCQVLLGVLCVYLTLEAFQVNTKASFIYSLFILLLSFPFLFLIERGNIDLLVCFFLVLGLLLYQKELKYLAGITLALSIALKLYPILLIIPLLLKKEKQATIGLLGMGIFLFVLFPKLNIEFLNSRILPMFTSDEFSRFTHFRMDENGSLANLFFGINYYFKSVFALEHLVSENMIFKFSTWLYLAMLTGLVFKNFGCRNKIPLAENITLYIPFMVAVPKLSFLYEYVILLPFMIVMLLKRDTYKSKMAQILFCLPFVLISLNTIVLEKLWQTERYYFLPSLGLFILMIYSIKYMKKNNQSILVTPQ